MGPMWDQLRKEGLELEPAVSLRSNIYLGCGQKEVQPDLQLISAKRELFTRLCLGGESGKPKCLDPPELKEDLEVKLPPRKSNKKNQNKT